MKTEKSSRQHTLATPYPPEGAHRHRHIFGAISHVQSAFLTSSGGYRYSGMDLTLSVPTRKAKMSQVTNEAGVPDIASRRRSKHRQLADN